MYSVRLENDSAKNAKDDATEGHLTNSPETGLRQVAQAGEGAHKARPVEDRVVFVARNDANQVILPTNTSIDEIEVDGNDLVFPQPNGEKVVVTNGALAIPSLFLGDVEIPFQVLATLLQNNDIHVAAGPDGNYTVQRNSVGSDLDDIQIGQALEGSGEEIELLEDFEEQQSPESESTSFVNDDQEAGSGSNVAPADTDTSVTMAEDTVLTGTIVASDLDGDTLSYSVSSNPANGSVVLSGNGYTYTPAADFNGTDSFDVLVEDGEGGTDTVTINVTVTPVNDAPVGVDASATTAEDTVLTGTIVASDVDGDALTYSVSSNPANGSVVLSSNGYTYTPAADFNGADSFVVLVDDGKGGTDRVTINVTVTPVNDTPVVTDASATTAEDTVLTGTIVASDVDGDALTYSVSSSPANGSVVLSGNGYTYTPAADFNGTDNFDVLVEDGEGGSDTVTISVTVTPVNDAPVGVDASASTAEDTVLRGTIVASDVDEDTLSYSVSSNPANGSVVLSGNGYTYTPAADFNGTDSFDVLVDDGNGGSDTVTISVTVTPLDDAPVGADAPATTAEDTVLTGTIVASDVDGDVLTYSVSSAPANGSVVLSGNGYTYTPAADFNGADSFDVLVEDGNGGSDTVTINVTVTPVNDAPVAAGDVYSTDEDTTLTIPAAGVLANDIDVDGDALSAVLVSDVLNGTLSLNADGSFNYVPDANFTGTDSFSYKPNDGTTDGNTVTVTINVGAVNDVPETSASSATGAEDATSIAVNLSGSDSDGTVSDFRIAALPANGTLYSDAALTTAIAAGSTVPANANAATVYFVPNANSNGDTTFTYTAIDNEGGEDATVATATITVTAVDDAPAAVGDAVTVAEDSGTTVLDVLGNDTDIDGGSKLIQSVTQPANGTVSIVNGGANVAFTPDADFNGTTSFTYTLNGGDTATVNVTVTPVNDAPVGVDASATTAEDTVLTGTIVASDVDGDTLSYSVSSNPANGSVVLSGNGYTYTPAADFNGADSFDVLVDDGNGGSDTVTINVTVTPVNDAPVGVDASASTAEDTVLMGTIVASDVDGDALTYSVSSNPTNGSVVLSGNGYTYTPAADFNGTDSFDVLVEDGEGGSDTVTISVTVTSVNDAPVGVDASATTAEDTVLTGTIVASDVDGDTLTYSVSSDPTNGSVVLSGNGYTYTPAADFNGTDNFDVLVNDRNGGTDTVTISVTVTPVNDAPVATDDNVSALAHTDEFLINSVTDGYQSSPSITALSDGGFLVTWSGSDDEDDSSNSGVKAQLFDRTGRAVGGEFLVNSHTDGTQTESSIAALSGGGFVVTWESNDGGDDSSGYGVKAQIFDSAGQTVGDEFLVNSKAHYDQRTPAATGLSNGGFVITWRSDDGEDDTSGFSIKAQIFDANGNTVGGEFLVNSQTYSGQVDPDIAALSNGGFVITWETNDGVDDASDSGIKAQIYNATGQTVGGEFLVNSQANDYQIEASATGLSNGGFVFTWQSYDGVQDKSGYGIKAQIYDATGQTVGDEFLVNSKTRWDQRTPVAAGLSNGGFVITWYSADREDDSSGYGIKAQVFDAAGQPAGDEFLVNSETNSDQYAPSIVALSDGGFVIVWQSFDGVDDASFTGIKAQIFDANGNPANGNFAGDFVYTLDTATLLSNDTDADGDVLTVDAVAATSAHGATVALNGDGTISFDPTGSAELQALGEGETLVDTFTYTISDGHGGQSTATVSLTIQGVNDAPVVQAVDAGTVSEDDAVQTINLLAGQSDVDTSDVLSVANIVVTDENDNAVSFTNHGDGTISIDPQQFDALNDGESRTVTVRYDVSDGTDNVANTATLVVNGATDNTAPVAHDDTVSQVGQSSEFLVNSLTDGYQDNPSVTGLPNGGFVITWNSSDGESDPDGYGIKAQLFDATGHAVGDEFLVNSRTNDNQNAPSIAALSSGGFVITWYSADGVNDLSSSGIKAQMFGADGQTVGGEFLVNSETYKNQEQPSITGLPGGGFVITWESLDGGDDPSSYSIKAQIYDATGQTVGGEFLVNSEKNSIQSAPSVTALSGGDFVITWHSLDGVDDKSDYGVKARIFDGNGGPAGAEFLVNSETYDGQRYPSITGLSGGGFVITWQSADGVDDKSDYGIKAQLYDATGQTLGAEFLVNSQTDGYQYPPSITALSDGGFVITWPSNDGSGDGIKAQIFDADGQAVGDEFLVNSETNDNQLAPSIAALSDGGFIITWHSFDGVDDTSSYGVKAQMFDAHGTPRGGDFSGNLFYTIDTATLLSNDTDIDGDVLTVEAVAATSAHGATVTLNGDGTISFDPTGSAELQALGQGETLVDTFSYTISDGHGGQSTATVSLTIQGVNDAPVVQAVDVTGTITEGSVLSDAGSLTFSDFDLTDRPTASETTVSVSGLGRDGVSTLSLTAAQQSAIETAFSISADAGNSNEGTINWSYNIAEAALDFLGEGETVIATFTITVTDDEGAAASQDVSISITGANDTPVVQAVDAGTVSEDDAVQTIDLLAGQSDVDTSDVLSVANIVVTDDNDNAVSFTNHGDGTISIDPQQFDALDDGESRTVTVRYDVSDGTDNVANTATLVVGGVTDNTAPVANNDTLDPTTEFQVNEHILGTQTGARVAILPNGGFVTTWASQDGEQGDTDGNAVKVRVFGANGDQPGAEFQANTTTTNDQARPDIAVLSDGRFIVVWQSSDQSVTDHNVIARLFAADGSPLSDEFVVSEYTNEDQLEPRIAVLPDDRVVVTWSSADQQQDTSGFAVKGRILTTDGTDPLEADGNEYVINYLTSSEQLDSDITVLPDGRVAVTWTSMDHTFGSDLDGSSIRLGFYNPDTGPTGEGIINAFKTGDQTNPAIAALTNGRVVVVWESADHQSSDQSGTAVYARVMTGPGSSVNTTEFLVSQNWDGDQLNPEVTALSDGGFVVTWDSVDGQLGDLSGRSLNGRVFEADGTPRTDEFLVNEITQGSQAQPNVVALQDGGFLVVWESNDGQQADNSDYGIKARIFNAYGIERGYGEDTVSTIDGADLLANDTDADGDSIFISTVSDTSHLGATVTLNGDGTISYDPTGASQIQELAIGETAEDTFTYSVSDGQGGTATATVTLTVVGANDAPMVQAINAGSVGEDDAAKTIDLLAGQADPDGDTLSATNITITDDLGGSVAFTNNGDGTISIDPTQFNDLIGGESRTVTINYDVADGSTTTANTATLVVNGADDFYTAVDDTIDPVTEFRVNTETQSYQQDPDITILKDGSFVVTWRSNDGEQDTSASGIKARIFNVDGSEKVAEFLVNEHTKYSQYAPVITTLADGGFVVAWYSSDNEQGDNSSTAINARVFNADGSARTAEFLANEITDDRQEYPSVTALSDGNFVIGWRTYAQELDDTSSSALDARVFDANGNAIEFLQNGTPGYTEFLVNSQTNSSQANIDMAMLHDGGFVATWDSNDRVDDTSFYGVKARIFNTDGSVGDEFLVNTFTIASQKEPAVAVLSNGNFVITWESGDTVNGDGDSYAIMARIFASDGTPITATEFQVNENAVRTQNMSQVTALEGGGFVVVWETDDIYDPDMDDDTSSLRARVFDAAGIGGTEFLVNEFTAREQEAAKIAGLPDGGFVVTWQSYDRQQGDDSSLAVKARIFNADGTERGISEDIGITIYKATLLANDTGVDPSETDIISVSATSAHGAVVTLNGDGTVSYDPSNAAEIQALDSGEALEDSFTYAIDDGHGGQSTATVSLTIEGANDAPVVQVVDAGTVSEDDAVQTINLLAGQSDVDASDVLSVANIVVTDENDNAVSFTNHGDGTISIDPQQFDALNDGESRTVTLRYDVSDGTDNVANTATLVVDGVADNTAPVATDDTVSPFAHAGEFKVNSETNGSQEEPSITALSGGGFVITWQSDDGAVDKSFTGIRAQMFGADGHAVGDEFLVNYETAGRQDSPSIAAMPGGGFAITWESEDRHDDSSGFGIKAQLFDSDGLAVGDEFGVNSQTFSNQISPSIAALTNGGLVIAWASADGVEDASSSGIKARLFDDNGNTVGGEFLVNREKNSSQVEPSITALSGGGFVITWVSYDGVDDKSLKGIKAQIFKANGDTLGDEFLVNSETFGFQEGPSITALSNGGFVITWQSDDGEDDHSATGIKARIYSADGQTVGNEFLVNSVTENGQYTPSITALSDGGFVVTWQSDDGEDDKSGAGIKARIFDGGGHAVGGEFLVNSETNDTQDAPGVAALPDGGFVVTWYSNDGVDDLSGSGIKAQIFDANGNPQGNNFSEDSVYTLDTATLLSNDTDADGDVLTVDAVAATSAHGASVTLNGDGTISYDPTDSAELQALGESETLVDTFTYTIDDGHGGQSTATVTLTVSGADENTPPVAVADFAGSGEVGEYGVNTTTASNQGSPTAVGLSGGNYVVTWDDPYLGIRAQLYDAHGNRIGSEFAVNQAVVTNEGDPAVEALSDGSFVIAWKAKDFSSSGIYAQHFGADGTKIGSEITVNTQTHDKQDTPDIAALPNGGFIITWRSYDGFDDEDGSGIKAQRFDADGQPVGGEFQVNTTETDDQYEADVVSLSDGSFIITWASLEGDAQGLGSMLKAQRFDEDGNKLGAEITLRDGSVSSDYYPDIDLLDNGNLAITYRSRNSNSFADDIRAQIIDSDGNAVVNEFVVSTNNAGFQFTSHLTALDNHGFVVSWYSGDGVQDQDSFGQKIRIYDANGVAQTGEILVNEHDAGFQMFGVVASVENGFVITWLDGGGNIDGDGDGIRAKIYNNDGTERGVDEVLETGSVTINVLANDTDIDGDTLSITGLDTSGTLGRVVDNHDGTFTYDASASAALRALSGHETETDTFSYTVSDGNGGTATASVSVLVNGVTNNTIATNIFGGDTDDTFTSFSGKTVMTGGGGADTFVLDTDALSNVGLADVLTDYSLSEGDEVDVSALLSNVLGHEASAAEDLAKLSVLTHGSDTFVKVDGHDVVTLQNYSGAVKLIYDDQDHVVTIDAS